MTDKELIKQEIERRYNCEKCYPNDREASVAAAVLQELLLFIDSLPEEHNEDLDEEISNYIKDNFFGSKSMGFLSNRTKGELDSIDVVNIARHFSEWQHGKDFDDLLQSEMEFPKEFYEKGRADMRKEMMKALVDGEVIKKTKQSTLC